MYVHNATMLSDGGHAVAGGFYEVIDVDPTEGVDLRQSQGQGDAFVSRFAADGTYLWCLTFGAEKCDRAYDVVETPANELLVVGNFRETVDFDPSEGVYEATSNGVFDGFILVLNEEGEFQQVVTIGGIGSDSVLYSVVFPNGDLFLSGNFHNTIDLDPSADGIDEYTTHGFDDVFVMSLDADLNYRWGHTFGGIENDILYTMAQLDADRVMVGGEYTNAVDFDPGPGTEEHIANGLCDAYVTVYDSEGQYQWTRTFGGIGLDDTQDVAVTSSGDVAIVGTFAQEVDFDPSDGEDIRISNGESDLFVAALDSDGNYLWTRTTGGSATESGIGVASTPMGDILLTGYFGDSGGGIGYPVDFDPDGDGDVHYSNGDLDIFLTRLNNDGSYGWTNTLGGVSVDIGYIITADAFGNLFLAGTFDDLVDFDPTEGEDLHISEGVNNAYVTMLTCVDASLCDGDVNADDVVDPLDSGYVLARFGCPVGTGDPLCDAADANLDLIVDPLDAGYVLSRFGECL